LDSQVEKIEKYNLRGVGRPGRIRTCDITVMSGSF
jgi:hypothetical protein